MIKDKLHTIYNEDAIEVARILLKSSQPYIYTFDKIIRIPHDPQDGTDSQEAVNVYFKATAETGIYKSVGWKDKKIMVQLIEYDRYHDYPYFVAFYMFEDSKHWKHEFLSNQIEAIEYLQKRSYI